MPARGDHDQRRRDVARIAADLVATGGLAAATHRRIAEASGASTTVVSHYFTDKHDLVKTTYTEVGDRVTARLQAAADSTDPLPSILEALLPLDEDRIRDWRLLFIFLGLAATDTELTAQQRSRATAARIRIEQAITAEQRAGRLRTDIDAEAAARLLLAAVLGIGMQALFDPAEWADDHIRDTLNEALAGLRPSSTAGEKRRRANSPASSRASNPRPSHRS
jgi:TetR/AcrR family transcriptional regulator, transcriptional repressor of bet genes